MRHLSNVQYQIPRGDGDKFYLCKDRTCHIEYYHYRIHAVQLGDQHRSTQSKGTVSQSPYRRFRYRPLEALSSGLLFLCYNFI